MSDCARYARYSSCGGCGRAPSSNITGVSPNAAIERATAARSAANSANVELTNTRKRWSGVRIAMPSCCSVVICGSLRWLTRRLGGHPWRAKKLSRAAWARFRHSQAYPRAPSSPAGDGGDDRDIRTVGDRRLDTVEIADVVGVDEQVDVDSRAAGLVADPPLQRRVRRCQRIEHRTDRHRRRVDDDDARSWRRRRGPAAESGAELGPPSWSANRRGPHGHDRRQVRRKLTPAVAVVGRCEELARPGPEVQPALARGRRS